MSKKECLILNIATERRHEDDIDRRKKMPFANFHPFCYYDAMLKIRLQRIGRKNQAHFRVILTDHKNAAKTGKFLKVLGSYNPHSSEFIVDAEEVKTRISQGAQLSDTVHNFLVKQGIIEGKKKNVLPKKSPTTKRKEAKATA